VNHGASGSLVTAVPDAGYHFVKWSDNVLTAARTDANVTADITVSAEFAINVYTLTYNAGSGGSIVGVSPQTVNHGASGTPVTAVPSAGYHFVKWSDNVLTAARTDANVTADLTVTAEFAINVYTLTYTAGSGGSIVGVSPQTVNHGASGSLVTAVPDAGYHFVKWSDNVLTAARTDANVTADITVSAEFAINVYTLTYTAGSGGTIGGTSPQTVAHGGSGTQVTATPNTGYHFVKWSDNVLTAARTDVNVTADINVTAEFAINVYTLTYTAGSGGTISGTSPQMVNHGASGTQVTAVPNTGYHFVRWSDNVLTAARTDVNVTADINVTAEFAINAYTLTYTAGANGSLSGTSPQTVAYGGSGTPVTAVPDVGYHFVKWSDNVLTAARTDVNVTADLTVSAEFAINVYTLTYTAGANGTLSGTSPQTVSYGGNGTPVTAVPNTGYHFVSWSDNVLTATRTETNVTADVNVTASFAANPPVAAVANLHAVQVRPGTAGEQTTPITLTWDVTPAGTTVEIWRKGFGSYPEYDDAGGATPTASASYPPGPGWVKVDGLTTPGGTDVNPARDFYFYVAYAQDGYGTWSPASTLTTGTLNYHLGDVSNGLAAGTGNNMVYSEDVSLLGANYGRAGGAMTVVNYLDVGPTTTMYVDGRPTTDNRIDFEDLLMFAINFGLGHPSVAPATAVAGTSAIAADEVLLDAPNHVTPGQTFAVRLTMRGTGTLIGLSTKLSWDPAVVEPVGHTIGDWLAQQQGQAFSAEPGMVDAAVMRAQGMTGEGVLATVAFRVLSAGDPKIGIAALDGRDAHNHKVDVRQSVQLQAPIVPLATQLSFARPNPFRQKVNIPFSLSAGGAVNLVIYSVDGRRVRTLVNETREPGEYTVIWDGRDENGSVAMAGVYYVRLITPQGRFTRTVTNLK
jgi:hypothetical protein